MTELPAGAFTDRADYPLLVVTASSSDGAQSGCLVGFMTQCSIEPVRFLVCLSKANHTFDVAARAAVLGVHLLGSSQRGLAELFGEETGDEIDKFTRCRWRRGNGGAPILEECAAWFEGAILDRLDLGDHVAHLLEPRHGGGGTRAGVLTFQQCRTLDAGHPAD